MKILEHNVQTGEVIERDATPEEIEFANAKAEEAATERANAKARAEAKVALLERLGITAEEATLLLA